MKSIILKRETEDVFSAIGNFPYWSDGSSINVRVAWAGGILSSIQAQAIDRKHGNCYLLISPMSFKRDSILDAARTLSIGESKTISV